MKRIDWIDIAKGLCIFLMVIGHAGLPMFLSKWIWSFHMPFFFFISGYCFNPDKYNNIFNLMWRKLRTLLFPFFFFSFVAFLLMMIYNIQNYKVLFVELLLKGWGGIALWFIPILFISELLGYITLKLSTLYSTVLLFIWLAIALYLCKNKINFPWNLSSVFISTFFFIMGFILKHELARFLNSTAIVKNRYVLLPTSIIISGTISYFIPKLDLCTNQVSPFYMLIPNAIMGIFSVLLLSQLIDKINNKFSKQIFIYLGKNTIEILAFSQVIMGCLIFLFRNIVMLNILSSCLRYILMWIFLFLIIQIMNTRLKWILGR